MCKYRTKPKMTKKYNKTFAGISNYDSDYNLYTKSSTIKAS